MYSDVFCKVYNEFGWNYYPEIFGQQLLTWLQSRGLQPKNSMDLACGTGILCQLLHDSGIQTAGMDFSSGMIDIARQGNPEISYEVADMITFRPETQYDLVTCTGDALNHIPDLADVARIQLTLQSGDPARQRISGVPGREQTLAYRTWRIAFVREKERVAVLGISSGYSPEELADAEDVYNDKKIHREFLGE